MARQRRRAGSFFRTMRQPTNSPWQSRLSLAVMVVMGIAVAILVSRNLVRHHSLTEWRQSLEVAAGRPAWPGWSRAWPELPARPKRDTRLPQEMRGAYAFAALNRELLQHIPCYCGCVREGHGSNLNCFVSGFRPDGSPIWTDHSFSCPMCVRIAREVMLMSSQGMPLEQIRAEIDKRYDGAGEATRTPKPAR